MEDVLRGPFSATITPVVQRHCVLSNTGLLCLKANWSLGNPFAIIPARLKVVLIKEAIKLWKKGRNYLPKFINLFSFWEIEAIRCKKLPGSLISHSLLPSKNSKLALIRMEREVRGPAAHLSRRTITSVSSLTDRHLTGLKCGGLGCLCAGRVGNLYRAKGITPFRNIMPNPLNVAWLEGNSSYDKIMTWSTAPDYARMVQIKMMIWNSESRQV